MRSISWRVAQEGPGMDAQGAVEPQLRFFRVIHSPHGQIFAGTYPPTLSAALRIRPRHISLAPRPRRSGPLVILVGHELTGLRQHQRHIQHVLVNP